MELLLKKSDKRAARRAKAFRREYVRHMKVSQQQMQRLVETAESAVRLGALTALLQVAPPGSQLHAQALDGVRRMAVSLSSRQSEAVHVPLDSAENALQRRTLAAVTATTASYQFSWHT